MQYNAKNLEIVRDLDFIVSQNKMGDSS